MKTKVNLLFLLSFFIMPLAKSQVDQYQYRRPLLDVREDWHRIELPNELFGKVRKDMNDIRILGLTASGDTVEAPFFIDQKVAQRVEKNIPFQLINESKNEGSFFFTFEIDVLEPINEIDLQFGQDNFDWRINLEGSQDQKEWFTIVEDYRILSIKNSQTDYQFTTINLPMSSYGFYRIQFISLEKPILKSATIKSIEISAGSYKNYEPKSSNVQELADSKSTQIDIDLGMEVPVNGLNITVLDQFDYYRPVTIQYLSDSFETEKGRKYSYTKLTSATLSSMEEEPFFFNSTILRKIRVLISNHDNTPLTISTCAVKGYNYELIARFNEQAAYFLVYGNPTARRPDYDIHYFRDHVPNELVRLNMGDEELVSRKEADVISAWFENKIWLWGILLILIVVLGYNSIRMLKKA